MKVTFDYLDEFLRGAKVLRKKYPSFEDDYNSTAFQKLPDEIKRSVLMRLKDNGASHRQLERLTGVGRGLIQKL